MTATPNATIVGSSQRAPHPDAPPVIRWMVLCGAADESGRWLRDGLRVRGLHDVELVSVDELVYSPSLTHRVSTDTVATEIHLWDGRVIGSELRGVVNRATFLPLEHLDKVGEPDRSYATQELYALFASVLFGLPGRIVNRGGPCGLSGPTPHHAQWCVAASRAGLTVAHTRYPGTDTAQRRLSSRCQVLVVGAATIALHSSGSGSEAGSRSAVGSGVPPEVADGCRRLAASQGVEVLQVDFDDAEQWMFVGAEVHPDLRRGGDQVLDALVAYLAPGVST